MLYNNCTAVNTHPCPKPWTHDPTVHRGLILGNVWGMSGPSDMVPKDSFAAGSCGCEGA